MILSVHKPYLYAAVGRAESFGMPQEIRQVPRYAVLCPGSRNHLRTLMATPAGNRLRNPGSVRGGGERVLQTAVPSYPSKSREPLPSLAFTSFFVLTCFRLSHTIPVSNVGRNEGRNETTNVQVIGKRSG